MTWQALWVFRTVETIQVTACLICALATALTLKDALDTRRNILRDGTNHGAQLWSLVNVRGKVCLTAVQLVSLIMGSDRLFLLLSGYVPTMPCRFVVFGILRTGMSGLVAITAMLNMVAFRRMRKNDTP